MRLMDRSAEGLAITREREAAIDGGERFLLSVQMFHAMTSLNFEISSHDPQALVVAGRVTLAKQKA